MSIVRFEVKGEFSWLARFTFLAFGFAGFVEEHLTGLGDAATGACEVDPAVAIPHAFAAGEDGGTVDAGKRVGFGEQRAEVADLAAVDMHETNGDIVVKVDLPGVAKDEVQIDLNDSTLVIKGERKKEEEVKGTSQQSNPLQTQSITGHERAFSEQFVE